MTRPIVIVGASLAGLRAAQAIRTAGHDGPVLVVVLCNSSTWRTGKC